LLVALVFFGMAFLRRRQAQKQKADVEHAILKQLTMPTLEELDGEMPESDPFAPGADDTEGMNILEKTTFLEKLEVRKKKSKDPNFLAFDPKEILEDCAIDSAVTGYLFAGKYEPSTEKASVVAVARRSKMKGKADEVMGSGGSKKLENFHSERADALLLAGNRLPMSTSHPFRILDMPVQLEDPLQDRQVVVSDE